MTLLVISDTHIPHRASWIPDEVEEAAQRADGVVHAGDVTGPELLDWLRGLGKPLWAVRGNMDPPALASLPDKLVVEIGGLRVGITHGWGAPLGIKKRVLEFFTHEEVRVIIFGHTHRAYLGWHGETLLLNPGSSTDTFFAERRSYALLRVRDGEPEAEIRYI